MVRHALVRYAGTAQACSGLRCCKSTAHAANPMAKFAVILPAAGRSSRFKDDYYKKPFVPLAGPPVWLYSAERFCSATTWCRCWL